MIGLIFDKIKIYSRASVVRVDGGLSRSTLFLRLLATALGTIVERQRDVETTARGVAALLKVFKGDWSLNDVIKGVHVNVELRVEPGEERLSLNRDIVKRIIEGMRCRA